MTGFVLRRGAQMLLSLWAAVTLVFVAVTQLPGDPVRALFGFTPPPPELYAAVRRQFHLDRPLPVQYLLHLRDVATGDLGRSYPSDPFGDPSAGALVSDVVAATAPVSAVLLGGALVVQLAVGVTAGTLAAGSGRRAGAVVHGLALLLVSTPVLVAAHVLRTALGTQLRWFPVAGVSAGPQAYVLPVLALAGLSTGYVALLTNAQLGEALRSGHVRAARARGLRPWRVVGVHALRPALTAVVTFVAADVGPLVVGLVVVEGVFDLPGLGGTLLAAIKARDRSLLVGLVTVVMAAVIVASAVADAAAAALDPRVRLAGARGR